MHIIFHPIKCIKTVNNLLRYSFFIPSKREFIRLTENVKYSNDNTTLLTEKIPGNIPHEDEGIPNKENKIIESPGIMSVSQLPIIQKLKFYHIPYMVPVTKQIMEEIISLFYHSSKPITPSDVFTVIECFTKHIIIHFPSVEEYLLTSVWHAVSKHGIKLEVSCYNALLQAYVENDYAYLPIDLSELETKGLTDATTYKWFIKYYLI